MFKIFGFLLKNEGLLLRKRSFRRRTKLYSQIEKKVKFDSQACDFLFIKSEKMKSFYNKKARDVVFSTGQKV